MENKQDRHVFDCGCEIPIVDGVPQIDYDNLNLDCPKVWALYKSGYTQSVFQLEKYLGKTYSKELKPNNILDAAALIAIIRPSCVSEDSKIMTTYSKLKTNGRPYAKAVSIKQLYKNRSYYNNIVSLDEKSGIFVDNKMLNIFPTGKKECFKINVRRYRKNTAKVKVGCDQYNLECTSDHKILTPIGWVELKDLKIGDRMASRKFTAPKNMRSDLISSRHSPKIKIPNTKGVSFFQEICYKNYYEKCCVCEWSKANLDVNHIDGNRHVDNNLNNLCFMCPNCHREYTLGLITKDELKKYQQKCLLPLYPSVDWVTYEGCESVGVKETYDISMSGPNHNFICGNIIVHNCLNSVDENGKCLTQVFCDRKNNGYELDTSEFGLLTKDTYSLIVFQESIMSAAKELAGFDGDQQVKIVKGVAKKDSTLLMTLKKEFVDGCKRLNKINSQQADLIWAQIESAGRYAFNKCLCPHSTFVKTKDGKTKSIYDLQIGEFIEAPNGFVEVLDVFDTGTQKLYEVILSCGLLIRCTMEHKFLCEDNKVHNLRSILENNFNILTKNSQKASSIESAQFCGWHEAYDITVDSNDHIYYANSIPTSNSHSVGYAVTGYQTAWVKAHLPYHYICAWLRISKNESKPLEEIRAMISEARRLKIPVLAPSLKNLPKTDFFINKQKVYFGINSIKNCSEKATEKLIEEQINLETCTWAEFLVIYSGLLTKTQIISMIRSGCFDYMGESRIKCEYEYNQWRAVTSAPRKKIQAFFNANPESSLSALISAYLDSLPKLGKQEEALKVIYDSLVNPPIDLEDSRNSIIEHEKELMGINISCSKIDRADVPDSRNTCAEANRKNKHKDKNYMFIIVGEITEYNEFTIKSGNMVGKIMANFKLVDESGECDVVCFPKELDLYQGALYESNVVLIKGKQSDRGGLIVSEVYEV